MQLCRMSLMQAEREIELQMSGSVITIGNFDGVHIGHQCVLAEVKKWAAMHQSPTVVLSFYPTPKRHFAKEKTFNNLMRLKEKFLTLKREGLDYLCLYRFNTQFANLSAENFVKDILVCQLSVKHVVVGEDFKFGKGRAGDVHTLAEMGKQNGFELSIVPSLMMDNEKVSSTRIRAALSVNDKKTAEKLLGRAL